MRRTFGPLTLVSALAFAGLVGPANSVLEARAAEEQGPVKSERGGIVATTGHYQFEVFCYRAGVRVFPQDHAGRPLDVSRLAGTATFYHPNSPTPWFSRPLRAATSASSLDLAIGLGNVPGRGARVVVEISGLPDPTESTARIAAPLDLIAAPAEGAAGTPTIRPMMPRGGGPAVTHDDGLGSYPSISRGPSLPRTSSPTVSLYGYGRTQAAGPGPNMPYISGHAVSILPSSGGDLIPVVPHWPITPGAPHGLGSRDWSTGRDAPLARPWLRPMD